MVVFSIAITMKNHCPMLRRGQSCVHSIFAQLFFPKRYFHFDVDHRPPCVCMNTVCHELRNPLHVLKSSVGTLYEAAVKGSPRSSATVGALRDAVVAPHTTITNGCGVCSGDSGSGSGSSSGSGCTSGKERAHSGAGIALSGLLLSSGESVSSAGKRAYARHTPVVLSPFSIVRLSHVHTSGVAVVWYRL